VSAVKFPPGSSPAAWQAGGQPTLSAEAGLTALRGQWADQTDHLRHDHRERPGLRLDRAGNSAAQPGRRHPGGHLQSAADRVVRSTCASVGQNVIDIPLGMTTSERVRWIAARLTKLGITVSPRPVSDHLPRPP